jgi:hypothetical protein
VGYDPEDGNHGGTVNYLIAKRHIRPH